MPDPTTSPTPKAAAFKAKGRPDMPKRQVYHADRKSVAIRRLTKALQVFRGTTRFSPEDRSCLAYFTLRYETGERPD